MATWDNAFEVSPADSDDPSFGAAKFRELKGAISDRLEKEHEFDLNESAPQARQGLHRSGSAVAFHQASAPTTRNGIALGTTDKGLFWVNSNDNSLNEWDGVAWVSVSSSGGASGAVGVTFAYGQFESTTLTGWAVYNDASGSEPTDGTGGSSAVGISRNATTPLFGTGDLIITKGASNMQGQGASSDFSIDRGLVGAPISLTFFYKVHSGTYVDADMGVYVYDVTNGALIRPTVTDLVGGGGNVIKASVLFNATTGTAYRLIFHVKTVSSAAYELRLDNINISPQYVAQGAAINGEQSYTPSFTGFGTPTNVDFKWWRVGDKMRIRGTFTTGTVTAVEAQITLPSGYTSDTSITTLAPCGIAGRSAAAAASYYMAIEPSKTYLVFTRQDSGQGSFTKLLANSFVGGSERVVVNAEIPISGWTSSVNLASDFQEFASNSQASINTNDTSSFQYGPEGAAILSNTAATYYDVKTSKPWGPTDIPRLEFRAKIDGTWHDVEECFVPSLLCHLKSQIYTDVGSGTNVSLMGSTVSKVASQLNRVWFFGNCIGLTSIGGSAPAGRSWANITGAADGFDRWRIRKISNGNSAEVPALIYAEVTGRTTFTSGPSLPIPFDGTGGAVVSDSSGAITASTGRFTCAIGGIYEITGIWAGTGSQVLSVYKNGTISKTLSQMENIDNYQTPFSRKIRLAAGDYIDFRLGGNICSSSTFEITRLGS